MPPVKSIADQEARKRNIREQDESLCSGLKSALTDVLAAAEFHVFTPPDVMIDRERGLAHCRVNCTWKLEGMQ
jgi:hypothetical protein